MEVKRGFKQTDIGVIPNDWEVRRLNNLADVRDGTHESPKFYKSGVPFVTSKNIINGHLDLTGVTYISEEDANAFNKRSKVNKGDILMSMIGTIGNAVLIDFEPDFCIKNVSLLKPLDVNPEFLIQLMQSPLFQTYLNSELAGGIQKFIALGKLRELQIPYPPPPEQRAIAAALSDVDALLAALNALIAKKRLIKQGAMQQLLTCKKRLPGFSGEWEVKKIGEMLDYEQPGKYLVKNTEYNKNGGTPVLTAGKTFILGFTDEEEGIYRNLPVIIFDDFTTASKYVDFPFKVKSSAIKLLKTKSDSADLRFMFEKMQTINFALGNHKRYYISEYQNIEINAPFLKEQQAITEILSDMDAEIAALEQQREKTRLLKQGMMQELLTGKTRLI